MGWPICVAPKLSKSPTILMQELKHAASVKTNNLTRKSDKESATVSETLFGSRLLQSETGLSANGTNFVL